MFIFKLNIFSYYIYVDYIMQNENTCSPLERCWIIELITCKKKKKKVHLWHITSLLLGLYQLDSKALPCHTTMPILDIQLTKHASLWTAGGNVCRIRENVQTMKKRQTRRLKQESGKNCTTVVCTFSSSIWKRLNLICFYI